MLGDVNARTVAGGAIVAGAAVVFQWPLSRTGLVVAAGLLGGLVVGLTLEPYESPVYQGVTAGAMGAVAYTAVLAVVGLSGGLGGLVVMLVLAAGMAMLLVAGAVAGAMAGARVAGRDAGDADDGGPTLRSGRTGDAAGDDRRDGGP